MYNRMKKLKTLALSSIMATTIIIPAVAFTQNAEAATIKPGVTKHTQQEIKKFYTDKKVNFSSPVTYSTTPKKNNVPGVLDTKTKNSALNTLNYVRYITGISTNVKINENYSAQTQAGAYLNDLLRADNWAYLSHSPSKPAGINNTIYKLGCAGAGSSNLSGESVLNTSILRWMNENNNISKDYPLGHRIYIVYPGLTETAFGSSKIGGGASAMYAFGKKEATSQKNVVWPAQQTPIDVFGNTKKWSVSSITTSFDINKVKVKITRTKDKKVWNISKSNTKDGSLFTQKFSSNTYLMFEPNNLVPAKNETYNVEISNLGSDTLSYSVTFFDINDVKTEPSVSVKVVNGVKKTYKGSSFYKYTGLAKYNGTWYYFADGVHNTKYVGTTGSTAYPSGQYFVKNGVWDKSYTGLAKNSKDSKWYYVYNGSHNKNYVGTTGSTANPSGQYFVKNGTWDKSYTGLAKNSKDGKWYYVTKGSHDKKYVGLSASTANSKKIFYVKNGTWQNTYTGKITYNNKTYNIKNGKVV